MTRDSIVVHPTAVVHPSALIGSGSRVGAYSVIEANVSIGEACSIAAHVVIKAHTGMGNANQIFENAVLGGVPQDFKFSDAVSYLVIGDQNVFREGCTVHRATEAGGKTVIGNSNYLMAYSHVAHNCVLEDFIILANNVALAGHVEIQHHAFLSGGVGVHQFSRIGCHAMVGGHSKIVKDVLPFFVTDGSPARSRSVNTVGLRRAGFKEEELSALRKSFHVLSQPGMKLKEKLQELKKIDSPHVTHLVSFIENSERGFCTAGRK
ncbi:MAG: acyl-ACP--UDP-N-acetylglucosamine O-acyltransferase [Acidobacteria bacterium]|nr:acyl-ACP--UDP-N-acetylglucosamine O-acyltransferase [Acidobacteriota bacterium]